MNFDEFKNVISNPDNMMNRMMNSNPLFRRFVDENRNLSAEQIAKKYGIDMSKIKEMLK